MEVTFLWRIISMQADKSDENFRDFMERQAVGVLRLDDLHKDSNGFFGHL